MQEPRPLFRPEVIEARRQRLQGSLTIRQSKMTIGGVAICTATFLTFLGIGIIVPFDRTVELPSVVVSAEPAIRLTSPVLATVSDVRVEEGQFVRKGQLLATCATERADATSSIEARQERSARMLEQVARRRIEVEEQLQISTRSDLGSETEKLASERLLLEQQAADKSEALKAARTSLESIRSVYARGYLSKRDYDARALAVLEANTALKEVLIRIADNRAQLDKSRRALSNATADAAARLAELQIGSIQAMDRVDQSASSAGFVLKAPADGVVASLLVAAGSVVGAGRPVMTILPSKHGLAVEAFAVSGAAGLLRAGKTVRLRYDAFPYRRFGTQTGHVDRISQTVVLPDEEPNLKLTEPSFRLRISHLEGPRLPLRPGMSATTLLVVERRSFWRWIVTQGQGS